MRYEGLYLGEGFTCVHASDLTDLSFSLVKGFQGQERPQHYYHDLLGRLPSKLRARLKALAPEDKWWKFDRSPQCRMDQIEKVKKIADILQAAGASLFGPSRKADCKLCGCACLCCSWNPSGEDYDSNATFHAASAGLICTSHSALGSHTGVAHRIMLETCLVLEEPLQIKDHV